MGTFAVVGKLVVDGAFVAQLGVGWSCVSRCGMLGRLAFCVVWLNGSCCACVCCVIDVRLSFGVACFVHALAELRLFAREVGGAQHCVGDGNVPLGLTSWISDS